MKLGIVNRCFLAIFFALIMGTTLMKAASVAGVEFPEWVGVGKASSNLEGRSYETLPELSAESIMSLEFQDSAEQYLSDLIPMRDSVLMFNAAVQRVGIESAASLFGYAVYPTYYGSKYVYDADADLVSRVLDSATEGKVNVYESAAGVYKSFADRHSDLNIIFYRTDRLNTSSNNPTYELVGDSVDGEFIKEHFYDLLGSEIEVIGDPSEFGENREDFYYRSDHHWNIEGAHLAYSQIAEALDMPVRELSNFENIVYDDVDFYGSFSRLGLCLIEDPDVISDYWFDSSSIKVVINGKNSSMESLAHYQKYTSGEVDQDIFKNRYAEYFHGDRGLIELHNEAASTNRSLLIVADSFSNPMERYFALDYRHVYVLDLRHAETTPDKLIAERSIDDVVFILSDVDQEPFLAGLE